MLNKARSLHKASEWRIDGQVADSTQLLHNLAALVYKLFLRHYL